ncbi:MAG: protein-export membrane protein SecF [Candidatus Levybacteria bacterium RBG_16_35_11]|nr:MAG: protein-export membrane protein SecF [Candidatus Levybacteria bacterium RBG_16_35_11]
MNIIGKKYWYFAISLIIIIPGLIAFILWGLNLSIDFTGGSRLTLSFKNGINNKTIDTVKGTLTSEKIKVYSVQESNNLLFVKTQVLNENQNKKFVSDLNKKSISFKEEEFETIGPTIGAETTTNAILAIIIASILIVLYISFSFRKVPKPTSSLRFGVCAIIALIHDVLVIIGLYAILGHFFGVETDSLFLTAVLTIIGFSVHDTIVVFDRIRENLKKTVNMPFAQVVNESILQTLDRSLNTSLTVILVLFALLLFGGETIRWFVVALLIGIISGTYSSIFNASPLLVVWHEWREKRRKIKQ